MFSWISVPSSAWLHLKRNVIYSPNKHEHNPIDSQYIPLIDADEIRKKQITNTFFREKKGWKQDVFEFLKICNKLLGSRVFM